MSQQPVSYEEIEPKLQTGDIFFAHGVSGESLRVEKLEHCLWSHVAMVVRGPNDEVLLWESTSLENLEDICFHVKKSGPQLVKLRERLTTDLKGNYDSMFAIRLLDVERTHSMNEHLEAFIAQVHNASFPSTIRMYWEVLEGKLGVKSSFKDFFCSKLVAETYIQLGLLSPTKPPNSYEPRDFSAQRPLSLLKGARLSEEILIDVNTI
ncbi:hypothetical protein [Paenibacillus arenosi]|uniref:Uncharacterized protein n=1 Tax=Paenibacillus arenosi TaxID=2774142 RepID=A0ABR9AT78_9BACL|nr:hypothetical protein [Paenibacillus arenosi]MBD8497327.1 hypothetical protein [Paenibacillus arenosi]